MRVLCCYVPGMLRDETRDRLQEYFPPTEFVDVSQTDFCYYYAIRDRWGTDDLVIVEQDILIDLSTLTSFSICYRDWCASGYEIFNPPEITYWSLGCTKFSRELQQCFPLPEEPVNFYMLDHVFREMLHNGGQSPHEHGLVEHLHDYPARDQLKGMPLHPVVLFRPEREQVYTDQRVSAEGRTPGQFADDVIQALRDRGWRHPEGIRERLAG
jgi:hypothetical protein